MKNHSHVLSSVHGGDQLLAQDTAVCAPPHCPSYSSSSVLKAGDDLLIRYVDDQTGARLIRVCPEDDIDCMQRLQAAYSLRNQLDRRWAVVPVALSRYAGRTALVSIDPGGVLLANHLQGTFDFESFMRLADALTTALCASHTAGVIHGNLRPGNILVDFDTCQSWLMGFADSDELNGYSEGEGADLSLIYRAPEQRGWLDRDIDARTDIYALGCIFHELLTGSAPPLAGTVATMHRDAAAHAVSASWHIAGIPSQVAAIVTKMLATLPENRYQSVASLAADLSLCRAFWRERQSIPSFPLDLYNIGHKFKSPAKTYGRVHELNVLTASLERVAATGKAEFALLTGYSGTGKSSLVASFIAGLAAKPHYYAAGKCDPLKSTVPYSAVAQAFQALLRPILGAEDATFHAMRARLTEALGVNAGVLAALVPSAALILGDLPPVPRLKPRLERIRFLRLTAQLLNAFATAQKPLILFFDDLQWADAGTLAVIRHLITDPGVQHVLIVAAYRDIGAQSSPTLQWLDDDAIRHQMVVVPAQPLRTTDLAELISDTLACTLLEALPLAKHVESRTGGEPFFAIRLLASLADEGAISFDYRECKWTWNLRGVAQIAHPDNIADFMRLRIASLSAQTQGTLHYLACLESSSLDILNVAMHGELSETLSALIDAQKQDLVVQQANNWRFWHDRVREAVYTSIPAAERQAFHFAIGRTLAACATIDLQGDQLFVVVNQINRGLPLVKSVAERQSFGRLNLAAGRRAKDAAEHVSALGYFAAAARLLSGTRESADRYAAEFHLSECEFLTGAGSFALKRLQRLSRNFLDLRLRTSVTRLLVTILTARDQTHDALDVALNYLRQAGEQLPAKPSADDVDDEFKRVVNLMNGRKPHDLLAMPLMRNMQLRSIMEVYVGLLPVAIFHDRNLRDLVLLRMTALSLEHGHCDASTHAYAGVVRALGARYGDYEMGIQFGELAMKLIDNKDLGSMKVRAQLAVGACVLPWSQPVKHAETLVREAMHTASVIGDLNYEIYSRRNLVSILIFSATPIREAMAQADAGLDIARKYGIDLMADSFTAQIWMLRQLCGLPIDEASLLTAGYDPRAIDRIAINTALPKSIAAFAHWTRQMQLALTFGDFEAALTAEREAAKHAWTSDSLVERVDYCCYGALAHAEALLARSFEIIPEHVVALYDRHNTLAVWARYCPENFRCRLALVEAQIACVEGRCADAEQRFEEAIKDARQHGFFQIEAMAAEAAARHYARRALHIVARSYLCHARQAYVSLGATAKVHAIDSVDTEEPAASTPRERRAADRSVCHGRNGHQSGSAAPPSGEMILSKLAGTIVTSSVEFAGAQRGILALYKGASLLVAASAHITRNGVALSMCPAELTYRDVPMTILKEVARTRSHIALDDVLESDAFASDPYIESNRPRSIACMPIIQQSRLTGMLYLENGIAAGVFTSRKIDVLVALATQAAAALENARIYARVTEESRPRDRAADASPHESQTEQARVKPLATMRELVASVVHEVAQPFATVGTAAIAALNWLSAPQPDIDQARNMVEQVVEQSSRGRSIVRSLRALVGDAAPSFELFDINESISQTLLQVRGRIREAHIELDTQSLNRNLPVYGDRTQLQQVVLNLLLNAMDAMEGVTGRRRILTINTSEPSTEDIFVAVEDTGPGIAPSVAGRLFSPFVTTKKEGLGMGLVICSMIIEAHGGVLTVEPGPESGSVFRFSLPRQSA
jgi:predicted ATPase/signal transduction histidine kinase